MEEYGQYVQGTIDPNIVAEIEASGIYVAVVSESPFYPKLDNRAPMFQIFNDNERWKNLEDSRTWCRIQSGIDPMLRFYVSDNGDWKEAKKAGFIYIDARMFSNAYE